MEKGDDLKDNLLRKGFVKVTSIPTEMTVVEGVETLMVPNVG